MHNLQPTLQADALDGFVSVERAADCLFVLVHAPASGAAQPVRFAALVLQLLQQYGIDRVVVEMDEAPLLDKQIIGELVQLHSDVHARGGAMRISGLATENEKILRRAMLENRFPRFVPRSNDDRNYAPRKPR